MRKEEKIFAREEHFCPYNKCTTCSGWGCEGEKCEFHPDYEDEGYSCDYDEDIEELLEKVNSKREAYDLGVLQGLDDGYLDGYKDCIKGEIPVIENAELQELIEQHYREEYLEEPEYDTAFLAYIKDLQDRISRLHKYSENEDFKREIMDIFHLITVITESQVMQPVYRFWIDLENN